MTDLTSLTDDFYVAPQLSPNELASLKDQGFTHLICNRPDNEEQGQPNRDVMEAAAEKAGLNYHFIPVGAPGISLEHMAETQGVLNDGGKVLAHCRSGRRSAILYAATKVHHGASMDDAIAKLSNAGFTDSDTIRAQLDAILS